MTNKERLIQCGIKPSLIRLKILDYVASSYDHPTVDDVYSALADFFPTLSKTTVYNTLHLFEGKGLVFSLNPNGNTAHYDAGTHFHGHFCCRLCDKIYDIPLEDASEETLCSSLPSGCLPESKVVYITGICPECANMPE